MRSSGAKVQWFYCSNFFLLKCHLLGSLLCLRCSVDLDRPDSQTPFQRNATIIMLINKIHKSRNGISVAALSFSAVEKVRRINISMLNMPIYIASTFCDFVVNDISLWLKFNV